MTEPIRWGILSTGSIANSLASALKTLPDAELVAVGSRSQDSADAFGDKYDIPNRYANYEDLAKDPNVDVVYIGTPHPFHYENCLMCLDNGKAVLNEKPFTINAGQTREVIERAREKGLFLMEAMWARFQPVMVRLRQLLAQGVIGDVRMVTADFGFRAEFDPKGRLFNPDLGGGALLDVGIYPLSIASMILGQPERIVSLAHLGETGVDEQAGMVLAHEGGALAILHCATRAETQNELWVSGERGRIHLPRKFWYPESLRILIDGEESETIHMPHDGNGYQYEAMEVMQCMRDGKTESDIMPLDETLALMETMDSIREQWGFRYPME